MRDHSGFRFWDTTRAEPVTAHYWAPMSSGIGMDGESIHAMLSADATRVFSGEKLLALRAQLAASKSPDLYTVWAQQILAEDAP